MAESKELEQIIERAVAQVLDRHIPKLQAEIVDRVLAALPAGSSDSVPSGGNSGTIYTNLVQAVATIHTGTTQKEILRALLDATTTIPLKSFRSI
jgi:hypothetical protein